jgi:putative ABC transport system substrate-binding protein
MQHRLNRRAVVTLLGGAAAWPQAARAQQSRKLPTIGYVGASTAGSRWLPTFVRRLRDLAWIEGRTVAIEMLERSLARPAGRERR